MYKIYRLENTQTLEEIANNLGVELDTLEMINGIDGNMLINEGEEIIIPAESMMGNYNQYTVKKGDSIYAIAKKYNVDYKKLLALNGLEEADYIYPNQQIIIPRSNLDMYVTEQNDTIESIINKLNTNIQDIMDQNATIYILPNQAIIYKNENRS